MKKLTPFVFAAAFGALMFGSCKKDHTCVCTYDGEELSRVTWTKITKKDAKAACDAANTHTFSGVSCKLD